MLKMSHYRIIGTLEWTDLHFCECSWCQGHGTGETRRAEISALALALDEQDAAERIKFIVAGHVDEIKWIEGPTAELLFLGVTDCEGDTTWPVDRVY